MKPTLKIIFIPFALIALLWLTVIPGYAQKPLPITVEVDRGSLTTDDYLTLTVSVNTEAGQPSQPMLPSLNGFNMMGSNTSSQINLINGAMSSQVIYQFQLQPIAAGNLTIDPINLTLNGQTYTTQPITIEVTPGTGAPAQPRRAPQMGQLAPQLPSALSQLLDPNFGGGFSSNFGDMLGGDSFVKAEVDNPNPYMGQPVVYTFRFYTSGLGMFDQPQYHQPKFTGFWAEPEKEPKQYQVQNNGQNYTVVEFRTLLFPTKVGPLTIEPAQLVTTGGFFDQGGTLQTEVINLEVKPLPTNAPASFNGAVGQFELAAGVDKTQTKVNEPITWQVSLKGRGNLNALPDPVWPDLPGWRSYNNQGAKTDTQFQEGQLVGQRLYERLLLPQQSGDLTIPALEFSYFDPEAEQYLTVATQPIAVTVMANDQAAATPSYAPTLNTAAQAGVTPAKPAASDIRYLKPIPATLGLAGSPLTASPLYWLAWAVPLAALAGNFVWQRREQFHQNNPGVNRSSQARKKAKQALVQVTRQKQDVYNAAGQILTTYLADKLNQPVAGLTQAALAQRLADEGTPVALIERVQTCLIEADLGRYAPEANQAGHAQSLLKQVERLINDLEKVL